jgi:hypothetical protein
MNSVFTDVFMNSVFMDVSFISMFFFCFNAGFYLMLDFG